jgi:hypothetical protein
LLQIQNQKQLTNSNTTHMKGFLLSLVAIAALALSSFGQSPEGFKYQAVVRDAGNLILSSQAVGMQLTIQQGSIGGTAVYTETFAPTTNAYGLVNLEIGSGTSADDFTTIDWANGPYFMETAVDVTGGTSYSVMGTSQLMSVPYALYANTSGNGAGPIGPQGAVGNDGAVGATGPQGPTGADGTTGASTALADADNDTKIQVEETADEDIIRFDIEGTERWVMQGARLEPTNTGNSVFIGQGAGANDDLTNNQNVFVGNNAGYSNTTGGSNTANGKDALYSNTTGYDNTANGYQALYSNTTGFQNTANGSRALLSNTTGNHNTANGSNALYSNTTGYYNTANGRSALYSNTTGFMNTANGQQALYSNTSGYYNTANGRSALYSNTTGYNNTANGYYALFNNTTGFRNTALGYSAFSSGTAYENSTALGYNAEPGASNTIRLGNSAVSTIGGYANWTNVSDGRFKTNVTENVSGIDFVMQLRPVTYNLDMDAIAKFNNTPDSLRLAESEALKAAELQSGFIAQEVEAAATAVGYDFHGVDKPKNETSHYGLRYAEFVVPMVKAMQEQQEMIEEQQATNEQQQEMMDAKDVRLDEQQEMIELMKGSMETKDVRLEKQDEMIEQLRTDLQQQINELKSKER